ncbi:MAG: polysaccharide biosynthesis/export family protein [Lachnoclostridium sp.]|nr:polysaccharide biosynthesis/export family protein [Lachnoclostridium sp.]
MNRRYIDINYTLPLLVLIAILASMTSCSSRKEIVYFQDVSRDTIIEGVAPKQIVIRPNDRLLIMVNSRDPKLADMFNIPYVTRQIGMSSKMSLGQNQGMLGYTVNENGDIDFPQLGEIHVAGLTRSQCAAKIKSDLISGGLVNDPTVTVEFMNTEYSVLGEVTAPGRYMVDRDNLTILEAIAEAKDLTIFGRRDNVKVIRTDDDGRQSTYLLDLTNIEELQKSPVYYLQPNDVVYVEPNNTRQRQSTVNGNNVISTSFWISLASLLTTVAVLVFK